MLFRSLSVHIPRRDASFRNSLANGQGLADEEGMRRITTSREDCLRVERQEGEFLSSGMADDRSEGHLNATCFSDISGIREVEPGWGLSLEKERRKTGGRTKVKSICVSGNNEQAHNTLHLNNSDDSTGEGAAEEPGL